MIHHLQMDIDFLPISDLPTIFFHFFFLSKLAHKIQRGQTKKSPVTRIIIFFTDAWTSHPRKHEEPGVKCIYCKTQLDNGQDGREGSKILLMLCSNGLLSDCI